MYRLLPASPGAFSFLLELKPDYLFEILVELYLLFVVYGAAFGETNSSNEGASTLFDLLISGNLRDSFALKDVCI